MTNARHNNNNNNNNARPDRQKKTFIFSWTGMEGVIDYLPPWLQRLYYREKHPANNTKKGRAEMEEYVRTYYGNRFEGFDPENLHDKWHVK